MHRMHKRPTAATVAERGSCAFRRPPKTPRRLSRQRDLILTRAKPSFAARRHTELNRLRLNAVRLGGSLELPRLSSRGFRCEKHPRRRLAADKICRVFHTLRGLFWRSGTPRSASLHVGLNACHRLRRFNLATPTSFPKSLRPLRILRFHQQANSKARVRKLRRMDAISSPY